MDIRTGLPWTAMFLLTHGASTIIYTIPTIAEIYSARRIFSLDIPGKNNAAYITGSATAVDLVNDKNPSVRPRRTAKTIDFRLRAFKNRKTDKTSRNVKTVSVNRNFVNVT